MGKLNSYLGTAENDYLYAENMMEIGKKLGNYNAVASIAAQSGEKYLKAVIEKCFVGDNDAVELLKSHNLRAIYNKIITRFSMSVTSRDCKWLGDFYFDARYPGDNFILVNEEDARECLEIVQSIGTDVKKIIADEERKRKDARSKLKGLGAFHEA